MKKVKLNNGFTRMVVILCIGLVISPSVLSISLNSRVNKLLKSVIKVDDDGDGDYIKIQDAIDNSTAGDIIEVYSGTYSDENVTLDKQVILKGVDSELGGGSGIGKPLVIGVINSQQEMGLITVLADGCSISGFHLKGKENSFCKTGIEILTKNNDIFQNDVENVNFGMNLVASTNRIYENYFPGTFYAVVSYSNDNEIFDNYACNNGYGVLVAYPAVNNKVYRNRIVNIDAVGIQTSRANNNFIFENTIINCLKGIECYNEGEGFEMTVYKNNITDCGHGIWSSSSRDRIYQNNITDCGEGIVYSPSFYHEDIAIFENNINFCETGINLGDLGDSEIYDNIIYACGTGIGTSNIYYCNIYKNNLTGNNNGIELGGSGLNNIFGNNISYNKVYGLLVHNSNENLIYHNNFIENQMNAYSDCLLLYPWQDYNTWDLGYKKNGGGNYWSDYHGRDKNHDGIGDTPYIIPDIYPNPLTNDKDGYPLMKPDGIPTYKLHIFNIFFIMILEKLSERFPLFEKFLLSIR